ncbi:hypothetical protein TNCV_1609921 [Trichonephila clavipes]|nr:hypothetical protein TNCV_1609921 [Trichonephila clavipes]
MDISPRKRTRIIIHSQHTSMTVRDITAAVGVGKSNVSRFINEQNNCETVLQNAGVNVDTNARPHLLQTNFLYEIVHTMHPYKTSRDLQRELLAIGVSVDSLTV